MTTTNGTDGMGARLEDLPLMLTVEEAARVLRIGRNGAYAAVADGLLPAVRIGRRIRIPRAGLAMLLRPDPSDAPPPPNQTLWEPADASPDVPPAGDPAGLHRR
ncbi:MAG: helix-turn-helix domain-containing protein [Actinomycetota bacterium]|nr:helix-turn-helix domain-containing protein [Actinomycetota bacterium]